MGDLDEMVIEPDSAGDKSTTSDSVTNDIKVGEGELSKEQASEVSAAKQGSDLFSDINKLTKSYKELQGAFTQKSQKASELDKQLSEINKVTEKFGGLENMAAWANYIATDKDFVSLMEVKSGKAKPPVVADTPEAKAAYDIITSIVESKLGEFRSLVDKAISPVITETHEKRAMDVISHLDKIDPDWKVVGKTMGELLQRLPDSVKENPSKDDIEDLYWTAIRREGKLDEAFKKRYEADVKAKKAKNMTLSTPAGITPNTGKRKISFEQAFDNASKITGMSLS